MDTASTHSLGRALGGVPATPAHQVQRVLQVTETRWNVPQQGRARAGVAARTRGAAPGMLARRAR